MTGACHGVFAGSRRECGDGPGRRVAGWQQGAKVFGSYDHCEATGECGLDDEPSGGCGGAGSGQEQDAVG
jgi:hypothetical protein